MRFTTTTLPLLLLMAFLSAWTLAACDRNAAQATTTPAAQANQTIVDPLVAARQQALLDAEQLWRTQEITYYAMELRHYQPDEGTQVLQVVVADGEATILAHHCLPAANCDVVPLDPAELTIPHLFTIAHEMAPLRERSVNLRFDQAVGYPREISYDGGFWLIREFQAHN
jgi:hypothetical protein